MTLEGYGPQLAVTHEEYRQKAFLVISAMKFSSTLSGILFVSHNLRSLF